MPISARPQHIRPLANRDGVTSVRTALPIRGAAGQTHATLRGQASSRSQCADRIDLIRLRDGARLLVRPIRATDAPLLVDGFNRLSVRSRWFRFLTTKNQLSSAELTYLTDVDHVDHEALVAIDVASGRGVGVARYVRDPEDERTAELAFTVIDAWQRRGVATALLARLTDRARAAGVRHYAFLVSADNVASLQLLRGCGFDPGRAAETDGLIEARVPLPTRRRPSTAEPPPTRPRDRARRPRFRPERSRRPDS